MTGLDLIIFLALYLLSVGFVFSFREGRVFSIFLSIGNLAFYTANVSVGSERTMTEFLYWDGALRNIALITLGVSFLVIFFIAVKKRFSPDLIVLSTLLPVNSTLLLGAQRLDVISILWVITIVIISTLVALSHNKRTGAEESVQVFMKMTFVLLFNILGVSLFIYSTNSSYIFDIDVINSQIFTLSVLLIIFSWAAWALIFPFNSWFIDISRSRSFELLGLIIISVIYPYTIKLLDVGVSLFNALTFNKPELAFSVWLVCFISIAYSFLLASKVKNVGPFLALITSGMVSLSVFSITIDPLVYGIEKIYTYVLLSCIPSASLYILLAPAKNLGSALSLGKLRDLKQENNIYLFCMIYFLLLTAGFPLGFLFWNRIELLEGLQNSWSLFPVTLHVIGVILAVFPIFGLLSLTVDKSSQLRKGISCRESNFTAETIRVIFLVVMLTLSISPNLLMTYL